MAHPAPFVWLDRDGLGRHVYAYFRYDFEISSGVKSAIINLFADSRYQLRINDVFIGGGPVRFYPEHPEYDTYDITPHLKTGRNVIAVKALAFGLETFHSIFNRGGFTAWGAVVCADGATTDLSTAKGWLCHKADGYDRTAPKMSFTSCAIDLFDARKDVADWSGPGCDLSAWQPAIVLEKQESWGTLSPRSIPPLTQREIVPQRLLGAYELDDKE
jgi:alpha-L-rhamnosidase